MSGVDNSILIDWEVGLDFCKTHDPDCDLTRTVLRDIDRFGVDIHIRSQCLEQVTKTLTDVQMLLEYLRDNASMFLNSFSSNKALDQYKSDILNSSTLTGELGLDTGQMPDINELRTDVEDMGLKDFRKYTHNHLSLSVKAQRELNLLITKKRNTSGFTPHFFEAAIGQLISEGSQVEVLVDAYHWARTEGEYVLTRKGSKIYNHKSGIENAMGDSCYEILSPEDIMEVASQ